MSGQQRHGNRKVPQSWVMTVWFREEKFFILQPNSQMKPIQNILTIYHLIHKKDKLFLLFCSQVFARESSIISHAPVGPLAGPSSFVHFPNSNSQESLLFFSSLTFCFAPLPFTLLSCCFFFFLSSLMALFPFSLSLLVFLLLVLDNGVHCFGEKKLLKLQQFQWKQKWDASSCLSQKSSEFLGVFFSRQMKRTHHSAG